MSDITTGARRATYWYTWGIMIGFLLLALGAVGCLDPRQNSARKVVGSILLCAELLLVFVVYLAASVGTSLAHAF